MANESNLHPKRHCMVVFAHYPAGETRVQRQAEALINHGVEVDIICLRVIKTGTQPAEEMINGAQVYRLPSTRSYGNTGFVQQFLEYIAFFFRAMLALIRLYPQRRWSVVQIHNLPDFLVFAGWYPKLRGAKLILDIHDLMPEFFSTRSKRDMNSWLVRLIKWQERLSCRFANQVITVTKLWRQTLIDRGVPSDKISVIMNVADDRIFNRNNNPHPTVKNGDRFDLFYHGAIVPRYGIDLVLEAMARLRNDIPQINFTIHGQSEYKETLVRLASQLDLNDRVHFTNRFVPITDLPSLISAADVAVVPYRRDVFTEGILPTKLMEYTALGIPAIVARTPAIEAYFSDSMVEYFQAGDVDALISSIRRLYQDRERLQSLVKQSDQFNQCYNWTKHSEDYLALVNKLAES